MNIENPNSGDDAEEQHTEQETEEPEREGSETMGAEAASKRALEETERTASEAHSRATQALEAVSEVEALREEVAALQKELAELRELHAGHAVALKFLYANAKRQGVGKTMPQYEIPEELQPTIEALKEAESSGSAFDAEAIAESALEEEKGDDDGAASPAWMG